jgi:pimeloyl-ACP methyl ester carboxylesterase
VGTGRAAITSFGLAEQRAAAEFGLTITERFLPIGTPVGKARVIEAGSGSPVLFVHGGGGFAGQWLPLLAHVAGHRMIAVDRPGCGLSDGYVYSGVDDIRGHAVTFLGGVLDALGLDRAPVVANSMGGLWSLWLTLDRPERVSSLALLGCPALVAGTSAPAAMRVISRRGLGRALERPVTERSFARILTMMGHPGDVAHRLSPAFLELCVLAGNLPGAGSSFRSLLWRVLRLRGARPDCALGDDELRSIQRRPFVVWGQHDAFGGRDAAYRFASITGADLTFAGTAICRGSMIRSRSPRSFTLISPDDMALDADLFTPCGLPPAIGTAGDAGK